MNTDKPPKKYKPNTNPPDKFPGNTRDNKSDVPFIAGTLPGAYSYFANNR